MARKEDANEAGKAAMADLRELMKSYREMGPQAVLCDGDFSGWPDSGGDGSSSRSYRSTRRPK